MSFPKYPKYKDSGVEWLGEVPEHWDLRQLKHICHVFPSNVDKKSVEGEAAVLLCNYTDVYYNDRIVAGMDFMPATATEDQIAKFTLRAGDTIITKDSETADDIAVAAHVPHGMPGVVCGYHLSMVRPRENVNGAFVKRLFDSTYAKSCFAVRANGLTRVGLSQYELDNVDMPVPPPTEQALIASFLDLETAKIDALIAEQRRLIELLQEKRQAVISHAVTKGLNPDVPMKGSGIEWLGAIPSDWSTLPSRRLFSQRNESAEDGDKQVTASQKYGIVFQSDFVEMEGRRVVETITGMHTLRRVHPNDFVISLRSFQGGIEWCRIQGSITFHYVVLTPLKCVYEPFFAYLFKSDRYIQALRSTTNLIRDGQDLRFSHFVQVPLPIVPIEEQRRIAGYLDETVRQFDTLAEEAQRAVALLQERRSALISAAVTGQIDVRNHSSDGAAA